MTAIDARPETGMHDGIAEALYFADTEALSASGAKTLLHNPARFKWEQDNPPPPRDAFDLGHVAHELILGTGAGFLVIDADDWRGKAARAERDDARAQGLTPLLRADFSRARAMHDAVMAHPLAAKAFAEGRPEVSMWWEDEATGARLRGRIDWLRPSTITDLKTCRSAHPGDFQRDAFNFGYHVSAAHYVAGIEALTGERLPFVVVAVEKEPPHYVSVLTFDEDSLAIGAAEMRRATDLFAECMASGEWPDYGTDIHTLSPPRWLRRSQEF